MNKKVGTVDNQNIFNIYYDVLPIDDNYDDMTRCGNVINIKNTYDDYCDLKKNKTLYIAFKYSNQPLIFLINIHGQKISL